MNALIHWRYKSHRHHPRFYFWCLSVAANTTATAATPWDLSSMGSCLLFLLWRPFSTSFPWLAFPSYWRTHFYLQEKKSNTDIIKPGKYNNPLFVKVKDIAYFKEKEKGKRTQRASLEAWTNWLLAKRFEKHISPD